MFQASNLVLINGSLDPWHALGILKNMGPSTRAIYVDGTNETS